MQKKKFVLTTVLSALVIGASAVAASAATTVSNPPSTYVNANFGPYDLSQFNFFRSKTKLDYSSATADVFAQRTGNQVRLSVSSNADLYENSAAYSSYNMGIVHDGSANLTTVTVTPQSLTLSGTAHWAMNLWFDSDHNGEYFTWANNRLTGLGGDVYAIGPCKGVGGCTEMTDTLTIDETTPLFLIAKMGVNYVPGCNDVDYVATLAQINAGFCTKIPANTRVAMWVGIDIPGGTVGSGSATIGACRSATGNGQFKDKDGHVHDGQFHGNSCDRRGSSAQDNDENGHHFESSSVNSSTFTFDETSETITMIGTGLDDGLPVGFTLVVIDYGGLSPTLYDLTLTDGRTFLGTLVSGSVQFE